jgi:protein tyrosine phosphatase (PTP) superfamily phosphohydrolase (DUF442 family)
MKNEAIIGGIIVGGQPDAADLGSGRFAHVINVRPDDEPGNNSAELLRGSNAAYTSVPYTGDTIGVEHVERIRAAIDAHPGTTLIH